MKKITAYLSILGIVLTGCFLTGCEKNEARPLDFETEWKRSAQNPVFRDVIPHANYEVASDGQVFYDDHGGLSMIYSGDIEGRSSIKLARGSSWTDWEPYQALLFKEGPSGLDLHKETAFYRKSPTGKHQIYYIGYEDEDTYQAQIFLAEADALSGPYTQQQQPIIPRGKIADKPVYCITSPSVVEHDGLLYIVFIGWDAAPDEVSKTWIMGAISSDEGYTWSDFQVVDTPIGMEGQLTKKAEGNFIAVRTGIYKDKEAIYYATADHPFGPWQTNELPILVQKGPPYEKHEIIAPQITIDPSTTKEYLYYTGADYQSGWWMMLAGK